jgi:hypothetical protein
MGDAERSSKPSAPSKLGVRAVVAAILLMALLVAACVGVPTVCEEGKCAPALPAVALGQEALYRLEIFLVVFYGSLLILVPAYRGLVGGRLPTEISARGAKFAEDAADSIEATQKLVDELERGLRSVEASTLRAHLNINQIAEKSRVELRD